MAILVWAAGTFAWSLFANLVLGDTGYVARNLLLTLGLVALAGRVGLPPRALGLTADTARSGLAAGVVAIAVVAAALLLAVALADQIGLVQALLGDRRADLTTGSLVFAVLVRIPVGTVLFEEVLFRGVGLALLLERMPPTPAVVANSAVFGLWHVAPTITGLRLNDVDPASLVGLGGVLGAVLVTFLAGIIFAWLRLRSDSLLAPCLAHWATNALGLLAAAAR
ncbi:MAG: CPBP family intramembrane glutamic endopeptidase [Nitriliruptoraceae bacterium]